MSNTIKAGGKMSVTVSRRDAVTGFDLPKPITSDAQNERYIAVLLQMENKKHLTAGERNYMEVLAVLNRNL